MKRYVNGALLHEFLKENGLSKQWLAYQAGMHYTTIDQICRGKYNHALTEPHQRQILSAIESEGIGSLNQDQLFYREENDE